MDIVLKNCVPKPLAGTFSFHPIWGQEFRFSSSKNYQITAASGKGKSTLLHILHGSRSDFSGNLILNQRDSALFDADEWAEIRSQKIAFVFQDLRLFSHLSAYDNLRIRDAIFPVPDFENKVAEYSRILGMESHLEKICGLLSLGQQQRIAILRALLQDFECLIMDEPFSHLDKDLQSSTAELVEKILIEKKANMIVSALETETYLHFDERIEI